MRFLSAAVIGLLAATAAHAQVAEDEYARYELLAPDTASYRVVFDVTAATAGTQSFVAAIPRGAEVSAVSAIERSTGAPLSVKQSANSLLVSFTRPVPQGAETRIRVSLTLKDARRYSRRGDSIVFTGMPLAPRSAIVLPKGYALVAANVPVQVLEEPDGRIAASFMTPPFGAMNPAPGSTELYLRARPVTPRPAAATAPAAAGSPAAPPIADAPPREQPMNQIRVTERALQDREIVYFLKEPETHAFSLYHDYTAARQGERQYVNVVRAGSAVSEPSAKILDTGETLQTRTLTGADIAREKIDIPDRVEPDTQVVLIPFPPVKAGSTVRLRISETYTDPARYGLIDGQLMWHRSFGRPRNDMVLPAGWYLTTSSVPAVISEEQDGRVRLSFHNPRPDNLDVLVRGRRR